MPNFFDSSLYDIVVIGGGINGAGVARDAAGRGLSVLLVEQNDLANATSSASTKLIHGGLRYLEHYEFRLVREALIEREVLLRSAPHIIWPLSFVLPHHKGLRPQWMLRLGLFLYDHLGGRERLPATRKLDLRQSSEGRPLKNDFTTGFAYSDCWVDDARLVVLNAMDAARRGAVIRTRTRCERLSRCGDRWTITLRPEGGATETVTARSVVNAAGPWVTDIIDRADGVKRTADLRMVKGSHIVVPRIFEGDNAYIFQNGDGRIAFAIPYEGDFTLIGTTDVAFEGEAKDVHIEDDEVAYLLALVNQYLATPLQASDVVWTYSGVRPLYNDRSSNASAVTRDYVFDLDAVDGKAPMLSIFGGKITTYRKLAEHALGKLLPELDIKDVPWTRTSTLPGGDLPDGDVDAFKAGVQRKHPWLPGTLLHRWTRTYGSLLTHIIGQAASLEDLGREIVPGLYEAELAYLVEHEWAVSAEDIVWRRTKLGLHSPTAATAVADWLDSNKEAGIREAAGG